MLDLDLRQKNIVIDILKNYIPHHEVWAFGSRVNGTARKTSDIDLVIIDDIKIPDMLLIQLKDAFDKSRLDIKVDIVVWDELSAVFKQNIKNHYEVMQD